MTTKSIRFDEELIKQTTQITSKIGVDFSEYIRQAVAEKNAREQGNKEPLSKGDVKEIINTLAPALDKLAKYDQE